MALHSPNSTQHDRQEAERWLLAYRQMGDAWGFCIRALSDTTVPVEYQLYAAQTVRYKARTQLHLVSDGDLRGCAAEVQRFLLLGTSRHPAVVKQLCLALSNICLVGVSRGELTIDIVRTIPAGHRLLVLQYVAEEGSLADRQTQPAGSQGPQCLSLLTLARSLAPEALVMMEDIQEEHNLMRNVGEHTGLKISLLQCFAAWVHLGSLSHLDNPRSKGAVRKLLTLCLQVLQGEGEIDEEKLLFQCGVSTICEVLECTSPQMAMDLNQPLIALPEAARQAAAAGKVETAEGWCRVYAALCSCQLELLASSHAQADALRQGLLHCSLIPSLLDEKLVAEGPLGVWCDLMDLVLIRPASAGRDEEEQGDMEEDMEVAGLAPRRLSDPGCHPRCTEVLTSAYQELYQSA